jgi:integrase
LWLRPGRPGRPATWLVLDGSRQRGTGCGQSEFAGAEKALADYIRQKHATAIRVADTRNPSQVAIKDVLSLYARNVAPSHSRPWETDARIGHLEAFWAQHPLSYVTGATCRAYAAQRSTPAAARRELEDLRAAIVHHRKEGLHDKIVSVVLPDRAPSRERWLTREEAAQLIRSAWRYREVQKGVETDKHPRRHIARFMVMARYMGSRAAVICGASIAKKRPKGEPWIDLASGVFYGRPEGHRDTKKRRQTVRVPMPLLAHLRRWHAAGQRYAVEWRGERVRSITKAHAAVVFDAELGPDVTPHTWRHTVATWAVQGGADPVKVADYLAMSPETLLRVYRHHRPSDAAEVHAALRQKNAKDKREQKAIPAQGDAGKTP